MAIAVAVSAVQGGAMIGQVERSTVMRESSTARSVAAAVTAAVRDMVGRDTIDCSLAYECAEPLACPDASVTVTRASEDADRSHAPPIAPRLLNIPPPTN